MMGLAGLLGTVELKSRWSGRIRPVVTPEGVCFWRSRDFTQNKTQKSQCDVLGRGRFCKNKHLQKALKTNKCT